MRTIGVGVLGCGTVGTGVLRLLRDRAAQIRSRLGGDLVVRRVLARDPEKPRAPEIDRALLTFDAAAFLSDASIDSRAPRRSPRAAPARLSLGRIIRAHHVLSARDIATRLAPPEERSRGDRNRPARWHVRCSSELS